ncbi:hypothetical protein M408DRAFT_326851 [Serendipita vermifera MAFF 305830]|uniref:SEC7 domain-containing protein n=1 Tax=Serendipita vermifera MAFF 305830 TaxID=933852 RepID=A0A0C3B5V5_SERVB|nr:hypothetical protein M408DRAFT_326851 [Serendipita vermifera MAFF 305830]
MENPSSYNLAVPSTHLVYSEILSVTSAMRKNSRWATPTAYYPAAARASLATSFGLRAAVSQGVETSSNTRVSGHRDFDLMVGFEELKREIRGSNDLLDMPLPTILSPFLALIRSPTSTVPITSAALSSIHSFFTCGLISPTSPELRTALSDISNTVSHCKFDAGGNSADEAVIFRIMAVVRECICGPVGPLLGDIEVCEMLESVLTTCCQVRLGEALRRAAEYYMHDLVRVIFRRLESLDPDEVTPEEEETPTELRMNVSPTRDTIAQSIDQVIETPTEAPEREKTPVPVVHDAAPFGLPSVTELLKVLLSLLDPQAQQQLSRAHTDSLLIPSLTTLNVAFSTSGPTIARFPTLRQLVLDTGCKCLFQLARSDNPTVLSLALRTIATIFETMRPHLKLQQELLLSFLIDKLTPPPGSAGANGGRAHLGIAPKRQAGSNASNSDLADRNKEKEEDEDDSSKAASRAGRAGIVPARGETRELMLETLGHLSRYPEFMVDVWVNYDCDINCEDVFERLINFLVKSIQHADPQQKGAQLLCLDLLLSFVSHMAARVDQESSPWPEDYPSIPSILEAKSKKLMVLTGAARFNKHPKGGVAYLEEHGLVQSNVPTTATDAEKAESRAKSLATFLKNTPRLDKKLVGEYIAKPENIGILKAFMSLFDFNGVPIAEAMREMLEAFRLPGESQQIERITDTFAAKYFNSQPAEVKSQDAVHVLSFAIIMLNTDQHNPQVRKRMTFDDFKRNLRGVNDNSDFSVEFLQAIYDSIKKREIIMPDEHVGQLGFEYAWKELLIRSKQTRPLMFCRSSEFDGHMFRLVWRPVVTAISTAFRTLDDDYVVEKVIAGFRDCATLASHLQLPEVFDFIVMSLAYSTGLAEELNFPRQSNFPVVEVEGQTITVSALSVRFGKSLRSQLATVVLFNVLNGNANHLRESWPPIFEMFQTLFMYSLLPSRMLQMEDFLGGTSPIPMAASKPLQAGPRAEGGLLSALSSYLMTPYGSSTDSLIEATPEEIEKTMCAVDCIAACKLDELYSQIMELELDPLLAALKTIQEAADKRTVYRLKAKQNEEQPPPPGVPARERIIQPLPYDAASVFLLEMMISISSHTRQYISDVWPIVFDHISAILSQAQWFSILLVERAVMGLLKMCRIAADVPALRDQLFVALDTLGGLPPDVLNAVAEQLIAGLALLLQNHKSAIRSPTEWKLTYGLLRSTIVHPTASKQTLSLLASLIASESLPVESMEGLVMVLDEFATLAGTATERKRPTQQTARDPLVERGCTAVDQLFELRKDIVRIANTPSGQAQGWSVYALPLLVSLSHQSVNPSREVRHAAITYFQRAIMGPQILQGGGPPQIVIVFHQSVFPLVQDLLDPSVFARDPQPGGMSETRVRACGLLCRGFLYYLDALSVEPEMLTTLWLEVLDLLEELMKVDNRSQLFEAVPESLRNMLLVMHASGALIPPQSPEDRSEELQKRWDRTQEQMEKFLPNFLAEVIPSPVPATDPNQTAAAGVPPVSQSSEPAA